jgi:hypothetical protein
MFMFLKNNNRHILKHIYFDLPIPIEKFWFCVEYPPTVLCRGWISGGSFQPEAMSLVMTLKQWGLGLNVKLQFSQNFDLIQTQKVILMEVLVTIKCQMKIWGTSIEKLNCSLRYCGPSWKILLMSRRLTIPDLEPSSIYILHQNILLTDRFSMNTLTPK